jgi:hypothetical protein
MINRLREVMPPISAADLQRYFPNGVPGLSSVQGMVERLDQEEIARRIAASLAGLDRTKVTTFGQQISDYGAKHGIDIPPEVRSGDPQAIAQLLARTAKSEKGIEGTLRFLQLASSGAGLTGAAMAMTPFGRMRRLGLIGFLADPKSRSVLGPMISGLLRK